MSVAGQANSRLAAGCNHKCVNVLAVIHASGWVQCTVRCDYLLPGGKYMML